VDLSITAERDAEGRQVLRLAGALDLSSRDRLLDTAATVLAEGKPSGLVLDLGRVNFFDSSGIGAVVQLAGDAEDAGIGFALQRPHDRVLQVLEIAGLLDAWPIEDGPGSE
jgi:anti-sigma B factor antagonist